jgi:TetR/AcrR family transcriptional regulator
VPKAMPRPKTGAQEPSPPLAQRRLGSAGSKTRLLLLDAAEQLLRESGYASVTSRRLASEAGVKPQLVHYYFRTMDDLFVALFQRVAEDLYARYAEAAASEHSLRALWAISSDPAVVMLSNEFLALANHRKSLRAEIARFGDEARRNMVEIIERTMPDVADRTGLSPIVLAMLVENVGHGLMLEQSLGMTESHAEMRALIEKVMTGVGARSGSAAG